MKYRVNFVSNSSSASFIIRRDNLNAKQYQKLMDYPNLGHSYDSWNINYIDDYVEGSTTMDNGDLKTFMIGLGIDMRKVEWTDHHS